MSSQISITEAGINDIPVIQQVTNITWPVTYGEIVSAEQLNYMLELIYSTASLTQQMQRGDTFILAKENNNTIAFAAYALINEPEIYKLHKLYALPNQQGKGLGKLLIHYIVAQIKPLGATALQLNVNRYNKAKTFYEHLGFKVIKEEDINIGNSYFMNDYVLELAL